MKKTIVLLVIVSVLMVSLATAALESTKPVFTYKKDNYVQVKFTLTNVGATVEKGYIELALMKDTGGYSGLTSSLQACNPYMPWNRGYSYEIQPGASQDINIKISGYAFPCGNRWPVLTHVDQCCTDGTNEKTCTSKLPYKFEYKITSAPIVMHDCNVITGEVDQCDTNYQAKEYAVNTARLNCKTAVCLNPEMDNSVASCTLYGECYTGAQQSVSCDDGKTIIIRECGSDFMWRKTGKVCQVLTTDNTVVSSDTLAPPKDAAGNVDNSGESGTSGGSGGDGDTWIKGVDNNTVIIIGAALIVVLIIVLGGNSGRRRR